MEFQEAILQTRSSQDVSLFRKVAPSVVLILTLDNKFASGFLMQDNVVVKDTVILTNLHVVDHSRVVTVVFKPAASTGIPSADEVVKADVIKIDSQRDLAFIQPRAFPNHTVYPLEISSQELEVGADVRAIGHPQRQDWTYTKGIVSAVRPDYAWSTSPGASHRAAVIQTQTPINPGNSGGPLLSDDGKIVGVNSFILKEVEGLNFAVAAKEIRYFLNNPRTGLEYFESCKEPIMFYEGRNRDNNVLLRMISLRCDDVADITIVIPDDKRQPVYALVDLKRRGKPEGVIYDLHRSGKWELSFWDEKLDGTFRPEGTASRCGTDAEVLCAALR